MKTLTKIIGTGAITLASLTGCSKGYNDCEVYQGYSVNHSEGRVAYVFDSKTLDERGWRGPKHGVYGDPSLIDSLKIGEKYCFEIKGNKIVSIVPHNHKKQE